MLGLCLPFSRSAFLVLLLMVFIISMIIPKTLSFTTTSIIHSSLGRSRFSGLKSAIPRSRSRNQGLSMVLGVPKVPYRMPGGRHGEWVDIYQRLTRERIIFLGHDIDDETANQIIGLLLVRKKMVFVNFSMFNIFSLSPNINQYLDNENPSQPIYLYINCGGGSVIAGLAIFDAIQHIKSEVVTVNLGLAASMASFLLASGSRGRRMALPHSRVMIHQPSGGAQGQAEDIRIEASQIMRIRNSIVQQYAIMTGQTTDRIMKDLDR